MFLLNFDYEKRKIIQSNSKHGVLLQILSKWGELSFNWNVSTGLNDWATTAWTIFLALIYLKSLDCSLINSQTYMAIKNAKEIGVDSPKSNKIDAGKYLESMITEVQA